MNELEETNKRSNINGEHILTFDEFSDIEKKAAFYLEDEIIEYVIFRMKYRLIKKDGTGFSIYKISFQELWDMAQGISKPLDE